MRLAPRHALFAIQFFNKQDYKDAFRLPCIYADIKQGFMKSVLSMLRLRAR